MNKIYKVIWSKARGCYMVVSEIAKSTSKASAKKAVAAVVAGALIMSPMAGTYGTAYAATKAEAEAASEELVNTDDSRNIIDIGVTSAETVKSTNLTGPQQEQLEKLYDTGNGSNAVSVGTNTRAADSSIAIGVNSVSDGDSSVVLGNGAVQVGGGASVVVGKHAYGADGYATAVGNGAQATGFGSSAYGSDANAAGKSSLAVGDNAKVDKGAESATAVGNGANAKSISATAVGNNASAQAENATAIGKGATTWGTAPDAIAIGTSAVAQNANAIAMGKSAVAQNANSVAMGNEARTTVDGGVAIGSNSIADTAAGATGTSYNTATPVDSSSAAWTSGAGAVSVGTADVTRQITNVAAGTKATDAVNVAQLQNGVTYAGVDTVNDAKVTIADGKVTFTQTTRKDTIVDNVWTTGTESKTSTEIGSLVKSASGNTSTLTFGGESVDIEKTSAGLSADGKTLTVQVGDKEAVSLTDTNTATNDVNSVSTVSSDGVVTITQTSRQDTMKDGVWTKGEETSSSTEIGRIETSVSGNTNTLTFGGKNVAIEKTSADLSADGKTMTVKVGDNKAVSLTDTNTATNDVNSVSTVSADGVVTITQTSRQDTMVDGVWTKGEETSSSTEIGRIETSTSGNTNTLTLGGKDVAIEKTSAELSEDGRTLTVKVGDKEAVSLRDTNTAVDNVTNVNTKSADGVVTITQTSRQDTMVDGVWTKGEETSSSTEIGRIETSASGNTNTLTFGGKNVAIEKTSAELSADGRTLTVQVGDNEAVSLRDTNTAVNDVNSITSTNSNGEITLTQTSRQDTMVDGKWTRGEETVTQISDIASKSYVDNGFNNMNNRINSVEGRVNKLDTRINEVGAGAAALAALHPLETDNDEKLSFAAGVGNYRNKTAAALGIFYRPDDNVMMNVGGTIGNGDSMINVGISFALDRPEGKRRISKKVMAEEIESLQEQNASLMDQVAEQNEKIAKLEAMLMQLMSEK